MLLVFPKKRHDKFNVLLSVRLLSFFNSAFRKLLADKTFPLSGFSTFIKIMIFYPVRIDHMSNSLQIFYDFTANLREH